MRRSVNGIPSVVLPLRNHPTHATSWVCDITGITRNEMEMNVADGLSGNLSNIDTQIETAGSILFNQPVLGFIGQLQQGLPLLKGRVEPAGNVTPRDN